MAWLLGAPVGGGPPASRPRCVLLLVAPRVFRAPEAPAAREARRPHFVRRRASKPARALRTLRRPPHRRCFRLSLGNFACNSLTPAFRGSMKCLEFQRLHADA